VARADATSRQSFSWLLSRRGPRGPLIGAPSAPGGHSDPYSWFNPSQALLDGSKGLLAPLSRHSMPTAVRTILLAQLQPLVLHRRNSRASRSSYRVVPRQSSGGSVTDSMKPYLWWLVLGGSCC
jgi:hypothetical protein